MIGSKFQKQEVEKLDIKMAEEFLHEITEFINKLLSGLANEKTINLDFSSELEFYINESEWVTNQLRLTLQNFKHVVDHCNFSISSFAKASHNIRSMCTVSNFQISQVGRFKGFILDQGWVQIFEESIMSIKYSKANKMFILEVANANEPPEEEFQPRNSYVYKVNSKEMQQSNKPL